MVIVVVVVAVAVVAVVAVSARNRVRRGFAAAGNDLECAAPAPTNQTPANQTPANRLHSDGRPQGHAAPASLIFSLVFNFHRLSFRSSAPHVVVRAEHETMS